MLTVHHLDHSRSTRILWLLEELGVPYELKIYQRNPKTRLAPPELKAVHPLGKAPVISDGDLVVAESGAILEYLAETYAGQSGAHATTELAALEPARGTPAHRQHRFWMHYAEGSVMNWMVMKLVFGIIPTQPMPFFVRPIARALCNKVIDTLIDPNITQTLAFIDAHLKTHRWFAGEDITLADFQMSFAVDAALSRAPSGASYPYVSEWFERIQARPAYQRAIAKGGPTTSLK
jgi:glutathione S-transferase